MTIDTKAPFFSALVEGDCPGGCPAPAADNAPVVVCPTVEVPRLILTGQDVPQGDYRLYYVSCSNRPIQDVIATITLDVAGHLTLDQDFIAPIETLTVTIPGSLNNAEPTTGFFVFGLLAGTAQSIHAAATGYDPALIRWRCTTP